MRSSLVLTTALAIAAACNSPDGTGPSTAGPPPADLSRAMFEGSKHCSAGLVRVEVELLGDEPTLFYPGGAIVRISLDGRPYGLGRADRLRVNGHEARGTLLAEATEIEVYTGLGADCEWVSAQRIR